MLHRIQHRGGWDHHQGHVHRAGHLADVGVAAHPTNLGGGRVYCVHRAGEPTVDDVLEHPCADRLGVAACTDDNDRARLQKRTQTGGLRAVFTGLHHRQRTVGGVKVEGQLDHSAVEVVAHCVTRFTEHRDHLGVLRKDVCDEPGDTPLTRRSGKMFQQDRSDPPALMGV